ncbi:bifunctional adenosylcobinamide kinase/adenosylcobinamide-phosphate guanylyltransferase [Oceanibium sediminis]|uniref:bifunctional adenosylcobinamide kinase/adenosylcobinamide-phosphate guanylyltransferase n=1 Tax=Oceanibium sediminis TaxID=2026339 RepID=UPI000DD39072|nr:bifunctional adenosylcobinamide kinase/adenosylcobinamide-phosphate guanylyltransferase [Oceanibium sediminis]
MQTSLILGGARSGKTARALALAEAASPRRVYLATAEAFDGEMRERIERHKAERGTGWRTVEAPLDIAPAIAGCAGEEVLLIDCLTLWLSNLMHAEREVEAETEALISALGKAPCPVLLVSNELGLGLVPETPLGRRFRDAQGWLNQQVAAVADRVEFVAAGLPLALKG